MDLEIALLDRRHAGLRIDDPARRAQLSASLARHGQQAPVLVVRVGDRLVLIDGYGRVAALSQLGRDMVDGVVLEDVDEVGALLMRHRLQASRSTALEDGWLLVELLDVHGRTQNDLATALQKSPSWVSRRLALVRALPANAQEAVRRGTLPPHAAMKYLVPLARAKSSDCEALVTALGAQRVTTREIERLYLAWRRADPEQRALIVADPRLFLKVDAEVATDPIAPDEISVLVDDLEAVAGLCRRARKRLRNGVLDRATLSERATVGSAWRETREALGTLTSRMETEELDARSRHTHRDPEAREGGPQSAPDREIAQAVPKYDSDGPDSGNEGGAGVREGLEARAAPRSDS